MSRGVTSCGSPEHSKPLFAMKLTPARVIFLWWALCLGLFLLNWPVAYTRPHLGFVLMIWAGTLLLSAAAYGMATRSAARILSQGQQQEPLGNFAMRLPKVGVALSLMLLPLTVVNYSGLSIGEFDLALRDTATVYWATGETLSAGRASRTAFVVVLAVANLFALTSLPYFAFAWFRYRTASGWLVLSILPFAVMAIFTGRDYYIGLPATIIVVSALAGTRGYVILRRVGVVLGIFIGALIVWAIAQRRNDRSSYGRTNLTLEQCGPGTICDGSEPEGLVAFFASYATQGLQGLGVARDAVWHFGWMVAHSPPLSQVLGADTSLTVSGQLNQLGWSSSGLWSTGLTKIANDVPWILVPFVVAALFALFGKLWLASQLTVVHPVTVTVLAYTGYLLLFMPQNLTLAIDGPRYFAYLALTAFWLLHNLASKRHQRRKLGRRNPGFPLRDPPSASVA